MNETRLTAGKVLEDANGKPKALIEQLFGFKDDEVYSLHQEALSKEIEFNWGNSIWVKPGESLSSLFLETIETKLKADSSNTLDLKKINA